MTYDKRTHSHGITLEQVLFRYIEDLKQTGDDEEATYLVHLGAVEAAKSIDQLLGRLNKNIATLSDRLAGLEGMERLFQDAMSTLQRCRLKYRSHVGDMLERKRSVQSQRVAAALYATSAAGAGWSG